MIIEEQPIKLKIKLHLGTVEAVPGTCAGAVGAVPGSHTAKLAGGPSAVANKPLKVK